jgi:GNAT superfamily N-acetyltransferase
MQILTSRGEAIEPWLDRLAALRITVFREFPYLYDGDLDYERAYLATYMECPNSLCVLAVDGEQVVGASTGLPMRDADEDFQRPFLEAGADTASLDELFYFGESVLLASYRGHGIGHRFFDEREAFAKSLGAKTTTFCAVERPADHPMKPEGYRPLHDFWRKRGYTRRPELATTYAWLDLGEKEETNKPMVFWTHEL